MNAETEKYISEIDARCIREKDGVKVVLMRKVAPDLSWRKFAWGRVVADDFIKVSPLFDTVAQAIYYGDVVPLLTDEEWKGVDTKDVITDIPDAEKLDALSK